MKKPELKQSKLHGLIAEKMFAYGLDYDDIAKMMGVSTGTFYNRRKDLGKITLDELLKLSRALHIPADEIRRAIEF